tara:strand:- start:2248 stop:2673 length:426 start_codon:yes stop_codon:yes gene_type:complete
MAPVSYEIDRVISPIWSEADSSLRKKIVRLGILQYIKIEIEYMIEDQDTKNTELDDKYNQIIEHIQKEKMKNEQYKKFLIQHLNHVDKEILEGDNEKKWGTVDDYVLNSRKVFKQNEEQPLLNNLDLALNDSYNSSLYSFE